MAKKNKQSTVKGTTNQSHKDFASTKKVTKVKDPDYFYSMSMAPRVEEDMHWFQMLPAAFFTAFVIMIVRLYQYERPMNQFYWTNGGNDLTEFFSYYKVVGIVTCAILALVFLLYRVFTQSLYIKRCFYYIPMGIYSVFIILSYCMSDYKEFALWGFNDRFEGTITLLCYMLMLFFIINTVNNEKNVKWIVYSTVISSFLLSLLGLSQALGHDFFQTSFGKKLITPSWFWNNVDSLEFTFKNKEIYQTVYNINYVSFYLTLLIPLFGLLFVRAIQKGKEEQLFKKILWGVMFALTMYNLIGSQSSGGFLGMGVVVIIALILLNKTIFHWWKPVIALLVITLIVGGITYERWLPELTGAMHSVFRIEKNTTAKSTDVESTSEGIAQKGYIDYIETKGNDVILSYEGNKLTFTTYPEQPLAVKLTDGEGKDIDIALIEGTSASFKILDDRFDSFIIGPALDNANNNFLVINIDGVEWNFIINTDGGIKYRNPLGNFTSLEDIPSIGFNKNPSFGSGRGYIWSRTLPMMKETILIGYGADTYCIYFPHNDYVGKYNADWEVNLIIDKPHNMYMGAWTGTGGISVIALLALFILYVMQSIKLYFNRDYSSFTEYSGLGIFLGICGFLVSALVNDSTVSVMPMFYGLLGTGIAINILLKKQTTN